MTVADQPAPTPQPERAPVWPLVIADYKERFNGDLIDVMVVADMDGRDRVGRQRYGTPLTAGNGRDHLVDAYQEALDLAAYLRAWLDEHQEDESMRATVARVRDNYWGHMYTLWSLRSVIDELGGNTP